MAESTMVPSSVSMGFKPISIGNSLPSFFRPYRSRPAPMGRETGFVKKEPRSPGWCVPESLRHQHFDRLAQHLLALVAEHPFSLRVDHFDQPVRSIITIALGAASTTWRKRSSLLRRARSIESCWTMSGNTGAVDI